MNRHLIGVSHGNLRRRAQWSRRRISFEALDERLLLDAFGFDLRIDKSEYILGDRVNWEAWVSDCEFHGRNVGIHTASFNLIESRSERIGEARLGSGFTDYSLRSQGVSKLGGLYNVGAGQLGYDPLVVELGDMAEAPVLLAEGSFVASRGGDHTLSLEPAVNAFFAKRSGVVGTSYSEVASDSVSFTVAGASVPTVRLSANRAEISETGGSATISARLSEVLDQDVLVELGLTGTAALAEDYTSPTHILITAGNLSSGIQLKALPDLRIEGDETIVIDILSVDNGIEAGTQQTTLRIADDDRDLRPNDVLRFDVRTDKEQYSVGDDVQWQVYVSVENPVVNLGLHSVAFDLSESRSEQFNAATLADGFSDYAFRSQGLEGVGSLRLVGARQTGYDSAVVEVTAEHPGPILLAGGSFTLTTPGVHSLTLTPGTSRFFISGRQLQDYTATIADTVQFTVQTGLSPSVFLELDEARIAEAGGVGTLTARLSHASQQEVTIALDFGGTATKVVDYKVSAHQIVIAPGSSTGTAKIMAIDDGLLDVGETIIVEIAKVTNGVEANQQQLQLFVIDSSPTPRDTLVFSLDTDKNRYEPGETVHWEAYVGLQSGSETNFGIHTVTFDLVGSQLSQLGTFGSAFSNYEPWPGRIVGSALRGVRAELRDFYPRIAQLPSAAPDRQLLMRGEFTVTRVGTHSLTLRPQHNDFFTSGSAGVSAYTALIPAGTTFTVLAPASGAGSNSTGGTGSSSSSGDPEIIVGGEGNDGTGHLPPTDENVALEDGFLAPRPQPDLPRTAAERTSPRAAAAVFSDWPDNELASALIHLGAISGAEAWWLP